MIKRGRPKKLWETTAVALKRIWADEEGCGGYRIDHGECGKKTGNNNDKEVG